MSVVCRKVGNSTTVTIPNEIIKEIGLRPGDEMDIITDGRSITFIPIRKKLRGEIFLEEYYGKSIEEINRLSESDSEVDWGDPVGDEIW